VWQQGFEQHIQLGAILVARYGTLCIITLRTSFVAGALREMSVGLCRGNFFMYSACLGMFAKSSGTGFRAGMRVPSDEHGLLKSVGFLITGQCWTLPVIHKMNSQEWECGDDSLVLICVSVNILRRRGQFLCGKGKHP
jgi:hypothetical protein